MMKKEQGKLNFNEMPIDKLYIYIVDILQPYLKKTLATFSLCSRTITNSHKNELESKAMGELFAKLETLIDEHLKKDEQVYFPYLKSIMETTNRDKINDPALTIGKIRSEHHAISELFKSLRAFTNGYIPAVESSSIIKLCYAQLFNFEQDMLRHVFLEEEILFPKLRIHQ